MITEIFLLIAIGVAIAAAVAVAAPVAAAVAVGTPATVAAIPPMLLPFLELGLYSTRE